MIRLFDFFLSLLGLIILSPLIILVWTVGLFENGSPLFKQSRVGYKQKSFLLLKFRTMNKDTKTAATHLVNTSMITPFGFLLRRTKIDEIPQLFNVLLGDMSIVGPRPCLFNQKKLIAERKKRGVYKVKPGITGLAQISGVNMKTPTLLAKLDLEMIKGMNLYNYLMYVMKTMIIIFTKQK